MNNNFNILRVLAIYIAVLAIFACNSWSESSENNAVMPLEIPYYSSIFIFEPIDEDYLLSFNKISKSEIFLAYQYKSPIFNIIKKDMSRSIIAHNDELSDIEDSLVMADPIVEIPKITPEETFKVAKVVKPELKENLDKEDLDTFEEIDDFENTFEKYARKSITTSFVKILQEKDIDPSQSIEIVSLPKNPTSSQVKKIVSKKIKIKKVVKTKKKFKKKLSLIDKNGMPVKEKFARTDPRLEDTQMPAYAPGRFIVKFKSEGDHAVDTCAECLVNSKSSFKHHVTSNSNSLDELNKGCGVHKAKSMFIKRHGLNAKQAAAKQRKIIDKIKGANSKRTKRMKREITPPDMTNTYIFEVPENVDVEMACELYRNDPHVEYAHPDYLVEDLTNDTFYSLLWGLENTGQTVNSTAGTADADIDQDIADNLSKGNGIVVAVVDSGVEYTHTDLAANIWSNSDESIGDANGDGRPGISGVDDDGDGLIDEDSAGREPGDAGYTNDLANDDDENGFIDDIRGWDFSTCTMFDSDTFACLNPHPEDNDPMDDYFHGTHVAGTIAAVADNFTGVAGVAPQAEIMPLKGLIPTTGGGSSGFTSWLTSGIVYAAENGADVINNSWGCSGTCPSVNTALQNAIILARSVGAVVVFAAGNSSVSVDSVFPQNMDETITVSASDQNDTIASFSNTGNAIDVAAPGVNVASTTLSNNYGYANGTSMAAPHVAGVTALIMEHHKDYYGVGSGFSVDQIETILEKTADDKGPAGFDTGFGHGRVNANEALTLTRVEPVISAIGNQSVDAGSNLAFVVSATDPNSDTLSWSALLSGGAAISTIGATLTDNGNGTANFSWTPSGAQAGLNPSIVFTVTDSPDGFIDSETITITVNSVNNAPVLSAIGDQSVDENATLPLTLSATDADGDPITYSATGLESWMSLTGSSFSATPGFGDSGSYNVTFSASDGTDSDSEAITITVNNVNRAPVLAAIGNQSVDENATLPLTLSATDADGDSITYSATGLESWMSLTGSSFSATPGFSDAGVYNVTFSASDGTDSDSEAITITVNNVNRAPVLASIGNLQTNINTTLNHTLSATDADGDSITYSATGLESWMSLTGTSFSATPLSGDDGNYTVTFTASDGTDNDSETITFTAGVVNQPPVLASIGAQAINENATLPLTLSATDPESDPLTYSATGLESWMSLTGTSFSATPGFSDAGSYNVTFTVSDGSLSDSEVVTITVNNVNRAPVLAAIGNQSVNENATLPLTLSATDADGDAITYNATGLESWMSLSGSSFSATPGFSDAGVYNVTFSASDGTDTDSEAITITVNNVNRAPVLAAIGNQSVDENATLPLTLSATDADGDSITYSATGLESWMSLSGSSFSATPGFSDSGVYNVTFTASDGTDSDSEAITVTVNDVAVCGNGVTEGSETCDDGNTTGGDGCSATCQIEACQNGVVDVGEECDDGNAVDGDGCTSLCIDEVCGDGTINNSGSETCDDGNTTSGDGCSSVCQIEVCGNSIVDVGEECDDGNTTGGDGCSASCKPEICGNSIVDVGEECDDGNIILFDGCDASCNLEPAVCGNGRCEEGEDCSSCYYDCGYQCRGGGLR